MRVGFFRRKGAEGGDGSAATSKGTRPVLGREVRCRVCEKAQQFSKCWLRVELLQKCPECEMVFEDPEFIYNQRIPSCPRCREYLEQPGFEYGKCDACGSKFELVQGCVPNLLPNKAQRDAMDRVGRTREII